MPPNASAAAAAPGRVQTAPGKTAHAAAPAVVNIKLSPSESSSSTALVSLLRRRVRPHVHAAARGGVPLVRWVQRAFHGSTPWHALLRILVAANALAVSEEFYATALPAAMWIGRWRWASYALCAQALSLALGNALKDTFACPRPWQLAKDVVAIDQVGSCPVMDEYGFPSTHSWNGLCLGTSLALLAVAELGVGPLTAGMCAGAWVAFVAFGRLYVGAHTLVDIMGGLVMGMLTTAFVYAALGPLAALLMECEHPALAATCTVCLCAALLDLAHTTPPMPTPSKKYARSLTATAAGVAVGFARVMSERGAIAVFFNTPLVLSSGVPPVLMAGARFFAGLSMALATKEVAKTAAKLLGMCGRDARKRGAAPVHERELAPAVAARYLQYSAMGWVIAEGAPAILVRLGL